jgi:N-acetylglucosamine malate deacetylase 1
MKLDILAFGAHPDDVELSCSGTMIKHARLGFKTGIVDLTLGELGTRGTPEIRAQEAADASVILGIQARENLFLQDGFFENNEQSRHRIIRAIRKFQPEIILANATHDRHPDHGRASALVEECCFLSGLIKIETYDEGHLQEPWRPRVIYHFIQDYWIDPDFIIDVSEYWDQRMDAVRAFKSQFYDPASAEPVTYISTPGFMDALKVRAQTLGRMIGVEYGEGFTSVRKIGAEHFFMLK